MATGAFRVLGAPRFRRYLPGQLLSLAGNWMQQVTIAWLAFQLTGLIAGVGIVVLLAQLPMLLLSPLAGVVNDRYVSIPNNRVNSSNQLRL